MSVCEACLLCVNSVTGLYPVALACQVVERASVEEDRGILGKQAALAATAMNEVSGNGEMSSCGP